MQSVPEILKKIRKLELRARRFVETAFAQYHSVFKGRGMNFHEFRQYDFGDEVRSIDWNVTARMGEPFVRKYIEERELTVMLLIDVSASGSYGSVNASKRELAAEVACLLAFCAIRNNDEVGLILFTDRAELYVAPRNGRTHILRLIREILYHEPAGRRTDLAEPLNFLNRVTTRRAVVFLLSDFQAVNYEKPLTICSRRHEDPSEAARDWMVAELARAFDITEAMFSWTLIKLAETRHFWCLIAHQLAVDGSARNLVARRMAENYSCLIDAVESKTKVPGHVLRSLA